MHINNILIFNKVYTLSQFLIHDYVKFLQIQMEHISLNMN